MKREFGFTGTKNSWAFFDDPSKDVQKLLELYGDQSGDFRTREDVIVDRMTKEVLKRHRRQIKLRLWKFFLQAVKRRFRLWYGLRIEPKVFALRKRFMSMAELEAAMQGRAHEIRGQDPPPSERMQKFVVGATEAFDVHFKKDVH